MGCTKEPTTAPEGSLKFDVQTHGNRRGVYYHPTRFDAWGAELVVFKPTR